jgi:flagellar basal-body rod protein FlgC
MGMFDVLKIGASGLKAQRTRMETIATNLANIHATRTEEGGPFRKKEVVFTTDDFARDLEMADTLQRKVQGVKVDEVVESEKPFEQVYDPYHPDANEEGYVSFPNVSVTEEMADMIAASRAYEANVNVLNTTKEMFMKTLEIGK